MEKLKERFKSLLTKLEESFVIDPEGTVYKLQLHTTEKWQKIIDQKKEKEMMAIKLLEKISKEEQEVAINLIDFYNDDLRSLPLRFDGEFKQLLHEATMDDVCAPTEAYGLFAFQAYKRAPEKPDFIIDLATPEGRLEARRRLGLMACLLKKQPKGESGVLPTDGGIVFGWVKFKDGIVHYFYVSGFFAEDDPEWVCNSNSMKKGWPYGAWWLSDNNEAFK